MSDTSKLPLERVNELIDKLNEINNRLINLENQKHIIETGQSEDGIQWYRIWSDGWIEQGGFVYLSGEVSVTVSFIKPYKISPTLTTNTDHLEPTNRDLDTPCTAGITNTNFIAYGKTNAVNLYWYACGY